MIAARINLFIFVNAELKMQLLVVIFVNLAYRNIEKSQEKHVFTNVVSISSNSQLYSYIEV